MVYYLAMPLVKVPPGADKTNSRDHTNNSSCSKYSAGILCRQIIGLLRVESLTKELFYDSLEKWWIWWILNIKAAVWVGLTSLDMVAKRISSC